MLSFPSFVLCRFLRVGSSLQDALKDESTKQPSLLAFGSRSSVQQIIPKIEESGFPLPSTNITAAVDYLFNSHYVFNLEYSASLVNFFIYLQTQVYGIKCTGKLPPRVTEGSCYMCDT